jgi:arsenate reductase
MNRAVPARPRILFVCVHNAGRSQMAAAFTEALGAERVEVRSAGSSPASAVNPRVLDAMKEVGIDLSKSSPKKLSDDVVRASDVVVTMGCGDTCPVFAGKRYEDWRVEDPSGQSLDKVREIRDVVRARVVRLLAELDVAPKDLGR